MEFQTTDQKLANAQTVHACLSTEPWTPKMTNIYVRAEQYVGVYWDTISLKHNETRYSDWQNAANKLQTLQYFRSRSTKMYEKIKRNLHILVKFAKNRIILKTGQLSGLLRFAIIYRKCRFYGPNRAEVNFPKLS